MLGNQQSVRALWARLVKGEHRQSSGRPMADTGYPLTAPAVHRLVGGKRPLRHLADGLGFSLSTLLIFTAMPA